MDAKELAALLESQSGVIRRRQVLDLGGTDNDIERPLRRREWARVHTGLYVDHTGPLSWVRAGVSDPEAWRSSGARRRRSSKGRLAEP
jgi:hypothetical protein